MPTRPVDDVGRFPEAHVIQADDYNDATTAGGTFQVEFSYHGYVVSVESNGTIRLRRAWTRPSLGDGASWPVRVSTRFCRPVGELRS